MQVGKEERMTEAKTCGIFYFNTCIIDFSYVKVVSRDDVPEEVWDILSRHEESLMYLNDQPRFFHEYIDSFEKSKKPGPVHCDFTVIIHED